MSADGVRIGLIGCGRIAQQVHLPVLTALAGARITALAEPDEKRRGEASARVPDATAMERWEDLIARDDVDAVIICLPTGMHASSAIASFDAGKHVYLEKPIATTADDGQAVIGAWRRSGRVGMIGFNYRFNPLLLAAKHQIDAGRIGKLVAARSVFSSSAATVPAWKQSRAGGGGVLLDLASHHADLARYLLGAEIREVWASVRTVRHSDDTATLEMHLSSGAVVQSFFSMAAIEEDRWEFFGEGGKLVVDRYASLDVEFTPTMRAYGRAKKLIAAAKSVTKAPYLLRKMLAPSGEPSYYAALSRFVEAVRTGNNATPDLADGLRSLAVIEAAEEAARSGGRVGVTDAIASSTRQAAHA